MSATGTLRTFLMNGGAASGAAAWGTTPLVPIKDYSDLEGTPNMIDVTTLSDSMTQQVPGVKQADAWEFMCNYDKTDYTTLKALEGVENHYAVWFGGTEAGGVVTPTGDLGKVAVTGYLSVGITGSGVDEAREMKVTIAKTSTPVVS